jgi:hypothetical protein
MGEYEIAKLAEVQLGEGRVQRTDEVFVEPLCFFDLEAYSLWGSELLFREVYYETNA